MTEDIGLGLIGAGGIARGMYVPMVQRLAGQGVRLVAVADVVPAQADSLAAATGATAYHDHRSLLDHPGVKAVIVATTISTHSPIALDALQAGKHVLLQKPMATTLVEADALIAAADERGLVLQCEPPHRMHPHAEQARQDLAAGMIGKLCLILARSAHNGPPNRPWFYFQEHGGSVIFDMGVHALTWLLGVAGPAKRVSAVYTRSIPERLINNVLLQPDIIDNALISLELENGALANVVTNYCTVASLSPSYELYGSEGTILVNAPQAGYMRFAAGGRLEHPDMAEQEMGWFIPARNTGHQALPWPPTSDTARLDVNRTTLGHFVECIRTGASPIPSATFARHTLEVMVKAALAASSGQAQRLTTTF